MERTDAVRVAMLTTVDDQAILRSRPMETPANGFDGALWFFTGLSAPKSKEIERHGNVNADTGKMLYLAALTRH